MDLGSSGSGGHIDGIERHLARAKQGSRFGFSIGLSGSDLGGYGPF